MDILKTHPQFIHMKVVSLGKTFSWLLSVIYGSPNPCLRRLLWQGLNQQYMNLNLPWFVAGDFNSVLTADEVSNKGKLDGRRCSGFLDWVSEHQLIDLGFSGQRFTWHSGTAPISFKGARLDRGVCNLEWRIRFEHAVVKHLPKSHSDHVPLLVDLQGPVNAAVQHSFRFQAAWITHPKFKQKVHSLWKNELSLMENNIEVAAGLSKWNREVFGNIFSKKKEVIGPT